MSGKGKRSHCARNRRTRPSGDRGKASPADVSRPPLSARKKITFAIFTVLLFFLLMEGALRLIGFQPMLAVEDPFVGFESKIPLFVPARGPAGREILVTADNKLELFNRQTFPQHKDSGAFRIFCLGGSTVYGRPYDDKTSFCGWLRAFLSEADPNRTWEVVNAGGISYASYRVAVVEEELTRYEPDLFIIYTGHNEFLERRTYGNIKEGSPIVRTAVRLLGHTRTYSALASIRKAWSPQTSRPQDGRDLLPAEVEEILDHSVGPASYVRDDALHAQVLKHYQFNLERMVDLARSCGARVIFVTPASNLRDCSPFKSETRADLADPDWQRWHDLYAQSQRLEREGRLDEALEVLAEAEQIDDRHAGLYFLKGRILFAKKRFTEAKQAFQRARDEDICPLRATTEMIQAVREVADRRGIPLIDYVAMIEDQSPGHIPGKEFFLDHVHPTIEGHRMLALALLSRMAETNLVHLAPTWGEAAIERITRKIETSLDPEVHARALLNLSKVLAWAGKTAEADRLVAEAAARGLSDDPDVLYGLGLTAERAGDWETAARHYRQALAVSPNHVRAQFKVGLIAARQNRLDQAAEAYRKVLRIKPEFAEARSNLADILAKQGDIAGALEQYQLALEHMPDIPNIHNNLAILLTRLGRLDEARRHLEQALRYNPNFPDAHYNLGVVLLNQGQFAQAADHLERVLRIDPASQRAREALALVRRIQQAGGTK